VYVPAAIAAVQVHEGFVVCCLSMYASACKLFVANLAGVFCWCRLAQWACSAGALLPGSATLGHAVKCTATATVMYHTAIATVLQAACVMCMVL
jgi:hypothetical protein